MYRFFVYSLFTFLLIPQFSFAQNPQLLFQSEIVKEEGEQLTFWYLEDHSLNLTHSEAKLHFENNASMVIDRFSATHPNIHWIKVNIPSVLLQEPLYVLQLKKWGTVDIWDYDQLTYLGKTGRLTTKNEVVYRNGILLKGNTLEPRQLLIRLKTGVSILSHENAQVTLLPHHHYEIEQLTERSIQMLFLGIILTMALYNLLIYKSIQDISYLYFVLSIVGIGLYMMFFHELNLEFLWPSAPNWDAHSFALIVPLTGIARTAFTKKYLHLDEYLPHWDKALTVVACGYLIPISLGLWSFFTDDDYLQVATQFIGIIGAIVLFSMLVSSLLVYLKGYAPARFFFIANILFIVSALLFISQETNLIPDLPYFSYFIEIGVVTQVVLFSLGLANRLKRSQELVHFNHLEKERLQKKNMEEKQKLISQQKTELKKQVKERTEELAHTIIQLQASEKSLKKINNLKDQLFSIISHDLKSPLVTFDSFLNLLIHHSHRMTQDEKEELADETNQALKKLYDLLENLLQWSSLQLKQNRINPENFDIEDLLHKNVSLYTLSAKRKNIQLRVNIPKASKKVRADYRMIDFIIRNLVNNAIKFTDKDGLIDLSLELQDEAIKVNVKDNGIGISEKNIQHILNKNDVFSLSGTEGEKGSGLGLMLCKEFLSLHDSQLGINSTLEKGSCFSFLLETVK
ncbi:sensor histidine kinase [Sediminitomix flava]|uniref:histidine kinase n=1 Tax=Sediminitomix flava TaxID=379075 RepID=A0A315ZHQ5_SEDFL|nr:sensor histidine kinase [Sediminitomix flava]PWJ44739.1 signal transduction histidine kinase [Sediminitomix flava]